MREAKTKLDGQISLEYQQLIGSGEIHGSWTLDEYERRRFKAVFRSQVSAV